MSGDKDSPPDDKQHQDQHKAFCHCAAPRCAQCGLNVEGKPSQEKAPENLLPSLKALKDLVEEALQPFTTDEVRRNCLYVCVSYSCQLGGVGSKLGSLESKKDILDCFCDEVGLRDVEPLISLMDLLSVGTLSEPVLKCKEVLLQHQSRTNPEGLSKCVECTSPPRTPVYPILCSRPSFLISGAFNLLTGIHQSPPSSPVSSSGSPISLEQSSLLPSELLQFIDGQGAMEVQPIHETGQ